jgi:hypothetical protein
MIHIIRRFTRSASSFETSADELALQAAHERLQNALHVLERTLQSMDCDTRETLSGNTFPQN